MAKPGHKRVRRAIIDACLEMNRTGINQGTSGNISARVDGGLLITPSGVPYEEMTPDQVVLIDDDGGYYGDFLPSTEWRMHYDIYRSIEAAGAVVHSHAPMCTSLSCLRVGIPAFHYMIGVGGGSDIRCADYATFGTEALSVNMLKALEDRTACLLANHGMICHAANLKRAMWLAVEVETLARQYWHARQAGEPVILPDDEMARVLARFRTYGKQAKDVVDGDAEAVIPPPHRGRTPA